MCSLYLKLSTQVFPACCATLVRAQLRMAKFSDPQLNNEARHARSTVILRPSCRHHGTVRRPLEEQSNNGQPCLLARACGNTSAVMSP